MKTYPKEWTQEQYLHAKECLEKKGIDLLLIDTILSPIQKAKTQVYNPIELKEAKEGTVFLFYCDTGKSTLNRLAEYQKRFPNNPCISLKGGKGYWRANMMILEDIECE